MVHDYRTNQRKHYGAGSSRQRHDAGFGIDIRKVGFGSFPFLAKLPRWQSVRARPMLAGIFVPNSGRCAEGLLDMAFKSYRPISDETRFEDDERERGPGVLTAARNANTSPLTTCHAAHPAGLMFWFKRNRLSGSYFAFNAARRA